MDKNQFQFHLAEYQSLKTEIEYRVRGTERVEYIVVIAMAAIYAWLAGPGSQYRNSTLLWWVPVALPIMGAFRQAALLRRIMHIAEYIRNIEVSICKTSPEGWETFLQQQRKKYVFSKLISISGYVFWLLILLISLAVAFHGGF